MSGLPETILQLVKSRSSFTESSSPDRGPSGLARPPEKPGKLQILLHSQTLPLMIASGKMSVLWNCIDS